MVLPAEEDGEKADDLPVFVEVEVEDGPVLRDAPGILAELGAAGALIGGVGQGSGVGADFFEAPVGHRDGAAWRFPFGDRALPYEAGD